MQQTIDRQNVVQLSNNEVTTLTIQKMYQLVDKDWMHPLIEEVTMDALQGCRGERVKDKAGAIHWWIKRNVKYVEDGELVWPWLIQDWEESREVEVLISPVRLLSMERPRGDCDDMSMLAMAMLRRCGVASSFVTIKGNPYARDEWSHVFVEVVTETDQRIAMDCSHGKYLGWETNGQWERKIW